jgi:hypothetical protein
MGEARRRRHTSRGDEFTITAEGDDWVVMRAYRADEERAAGPRP